MEEFFELFKTPWEVYQPGRHYDVVIAAEDEIPPVDATLLLIFGSGDKRSEPEHAFPQRTVLSGALVTWGNIKFPIYGQLATFVGLPTDQICMSTSTEAVGLRRQIGGQSAIIRLGYDLFDEVNRLLTQGQPVRHADTPTLDLHISVLRELILKARVPLVEIPPRPAGYQFSVCLTHDIDFISIRQHFLDHSMWGFVYRSLVGGGRDALRGRISLGRMVRMWLAVASLPLAYLGVTSDFWEPFAWYMRVERGLPATYFLIPFKRRAGQHVPGKSATRRATAYDVDDLREQVDLLIKSGCEVGLHGLDAWHSESSGRAELARIQGLIQARSIGVRMHWLLQDDNTTTVLDRSGFAYDSSGGYNETIGFRNGTTQVFRPLGSNNLLELPLHIQDGALFYREKLDLSEAEAAARCGGLAQWGQTLGGTLTLLWHDRSHAAERFWGDFYVAVVERLKSMKPWFGTAAAVVSWFRLRRDVQFIAQTPERRLSLQSRRGEPIHPPLTILVYRPALADDSTPNIEELRWDGATALELDLVQTAIGNSDSPAYSWR